MSATLARKSFSVRRFTDDSLDVSDITDLLSPFQIEKFSFLFKSLNQSGTGGIDEDDINNLDELLRNIAGWQKDDPRYLSIVDNNRAFLECMLEQVKRERHWNSGNDNITWDEAFKPSKVIVSSISLKNWLNMWARLCRGSAGMEDFPIWVQLLPKVLFNVIVAREGGDSISKSSLKNFYEKFAGLSGSELEKTTEEGYKLATANGDFILDFKTYQLLFSNYLLGKTIYGPGKYLFGVFDNSDSFVQYKVKFNAE